MTDCTMSARLLRTPALALWAVAVLVPLAVALVAAISGPDHAEVGIRISEALLRSALLAGAISGMAVLLGWIPGRLLGTCRRRADALLLLILMPLVLPKYVLHYAWTLLLSPTTEIGSYLALRPEMARAAGAATSVLVMTCWYWPLAALLLAQGWRNIDASIWDSASLEASGLKLFRYITLPLLGRTMLLAFAVCFVMSLAEFSTFHLAGVETIGTELAVLYELTGSIGAVARAAWPSALVALAVAFALGGVSRSWQSYRTVVTSARSTNPYWRWAVLAGLIVVSVGAPVFLLFYNMTDTTELRRFITLHIDELAWSLAIALAACLFACLIARAALPPADNGQKLSNRIRVRAAVSFTMRVTLFTAMFLPASVLAVSSLRALALFGFPITVRQSWLIVSLGHAARFAGVALVVFLLARRSSDKRLSEMASLDGASKMQKFLYVDLPRFWPLMAGASLLLIMLSITELSATMVLLPAGLPNFAQRLLNQMHYARDQQVIASCLVLMGLFVVLAVAAVLLLRIARMRCMATLVLTCVLSIAAAGCDKTLAQEPKVLDSFGRTGRGQCQFIYPRAIDIAPDGSLYVIDKTGRIQHLTNKGEFLSVIRMPKVDAGLPTGIAVGPGGNIYVADTHCYRVIVLSPSGQTLFEFGRYGAEEGCFIFPTDVAFAPDGRIFVSEYGGNDRVSIFTGTGQFISSFGAPGSGHGQFSRPAALAVDQSRRRLYIADACNHRIAVYDLDGALSHYIGSPGRDLGQLRYPYDLTLRDDGTIIVCEYGNNRIQSFDPDGNSLGICGSAGRRLGQLAYPWGVVTDRDRAYIVDAGNDRIQVWRL